jgi:hypothetical protein
VVLLDSKEETEYEIKLFENVKRDTLNVLQETQRRHDLELGVILGLLYGIIGNLFVQFFYPVIEKLVTSTFDIIFFSDLFISIVAFILIIAITREYMQRLRNLKSKSSTLEKSIKVFDNALQKRKQQLSE